ncbi:MAG: peroxidase family protein [Thermoanaerobaculia bacterium]
MRRLPALLVLSFLALAALATAQGTVRARRVSANNPRVRSSGASFLERAGGRELAPARFPQEFRTVTGRGNNGEHPSWGRAGIPLRRMASVGYADGISEPAGPNRSGARAVSNSCLAQDRSRPNSKRASSFLWQWGQFLDHDLSLTPFADPAEPFDIDVPRGDPFFDPTGTGEESMALDRSAWRSVSGVRQQVNAITAYIDASNVYGSDRRRARVLKARNGTGELALGDDDLLPLNRKRLPNAPSDDPGYFLAGDFRANEQVGLTAMHTVFVREHNHWARLISEAEPRLRPKKVYEMARAVVGAEIQAISYREFLPVLLGPHALTPYHGYDPTVDAGIANEFATAAYRVGHTMLPAELLRLDGAMQPIEAGPLALRDAFFSPDAFRQSGPDALLRGLKGQPAQEVDVEVIDDVRNFLFGSPGSGGFDLSALNIQRGRDHGLPGLNRTRMDYGLPPYADFAAVTPDPRAQEALAEVYASVDDVDLWVGGLVEPHRPGAMVGETFFTILKDQFERLRDGDRFWYESYLPSDWVHLVNHQTLARILRRNTGLGHEIGADAFLLPR